MFLLLFSNLRLRVSTILRITCLFYLFGGFSALAYNESVSIRVGGLLYAQSSIERTSSSESPRAGLSLSGEEPSLREFFAGLSAQPYVYTVSPFPNRFLQGSQAELVLKVSKGGFPVANYPVTFASTIPVLLVPSHADDGNTNTSTSSNLDSLSKTNINTNTAKASPNLDSPSADQRSQGGIAPDGEEKNIATEDEGQSIVTESEEQSIVTEGREENIPPGYARKFTRQTDALGEARLTFFIEDAGEHVLTALFIDSRTGYTEHIEVFSYATVPSMSFQNYFLTPWIGLFLGFFVLVLFGGVFSVKSSAQSANFPSSSASFSARLSTLLAPLIPSYAIFYGTSTAIEKARLPETKAEKDQSTQGESTEPSEDRQILSLVAIITTMATSLGLLIRRAATFLRVGVSPQWIKDFRETPVAFVLLLGVFVTVWLILMASIRDQDWAPLLLGGLGLLVFVAFPRMQITLAILLTVALIQYAAARQFVSLAPLPEPLVQTMVSTPIMELSFGLLLLLQFFLPLPLPVGLLALSDYLFYETPLQDELAWMTFVAFLSMFSMLRIPFRHS